MTEFNRQAAGLYARLGRADETLVLLRELTANGFAWGGFSLSHSPDFALIRHDPRFQELAAQAGALARAQPDPVDP
jgi:hypothetical protein